MSPRVSIIVTAYLPESKPYLDACIDSIRNLRYDNFETIIVGRHDYIPQYKGMVTIVPPEKVFWNSVGLNRGADWADPSSKYFFFLNDDVVLTRECLNELVHVLENNKTIGQLMPIGNDQMGKYSCPTFSAPIPFDQQATGVFPPVTFTADVLCTYAVLIPREVFKAVGPYDQELLGQDDIDYSWRVALKGYKNAITTSAVVWHWGGRSADITLNAEKRERGRDIFNKKWGIK